MKEDPRVDRYIEKAAPFAKPILTRLRALVHKGCPQAEETIKWGFPFFLCGGRILCGMAAFKAHCRFHFKDGAPSLEVREDPKATASVTYNFSRLTSPGDLPGDAHVVALVAKAAALVAAGSPRPRARVRRPKRVPAVPQDMASALQRSPAAAAAFGELSPSHRREYLEWILGAKREETRQRRIATALSWITSGKSLNWKYR